MKPRTKLQFEVIDFSSRLYNRENELLPWAKRECLDHIGYATKKRVVCMDCGGAFPPGLVKRKRAVCPHCGTKLKVDASRKTTHEQEVYFAIAELFRNYQVIRHFVLYSYHKAGNEAGYSCYEIVQRWIRADGKHETVARNHTLNFYVDSWNGVMEIRKNYKRYYHYNVDRYNIYPYKYHPDSEFRPEYRKWGIDHRLQGLTFLDAIRVIARNPKAETLLKAKQYALFGLCDGEESKINRYWRSIRICLRNRYIVKDAGIYLDYLDLLRYSGKDLHNAHYVCPKYLKRAHDRLMEKKWAIMEHDRMKGNYLRLLEHFGTSVDEKTFVYPKNLKREYDILLAREEQENIEKKQKERSEAEAKYHAFIHAFVGMTFQDKELVITPLKNIDEFKAEGDILHHCVYTNAYYKKENYLILSARIDGQPVETIEFDLKKMKVSQCRGRSNQNTEHHDRILRVMKRHEKDIAERVRMKICQ